MVRCGYAPILIAGTWRQTVKDRRSNMEYTRDKLFLGMNECGCTVFNEDGVIVIELCPLHEAAPDMYEALKLLATSYQIELDTSPDNLEYYGPDWQTLIKALAKVEDK